MFGCLLVRPVRTNLFFSPPLLVVVAAVVAVAFRPKQFSVAEDSLVVFVRKWHCTPARMNKCQAQALRALKNNLLSVIRVLDEGLKTAHESR